MADNEGKKLAYSVTLWDGVNNKYVTFYPGDQLPNWAAAQVRNPRAFVADDADSHPASLVPGRDIAIAGPSQVAHDVDPRFADQPRYVHHGDATPKGYDIADEQLPVVFAGPPQLHDHVAAKASSAEFTSPGREQTHKVRTGQVETEADRLRKQAQDRDLSDAARAAAIFEQQQRQQLMYQDEQQRQQLAQAQALQSQFAESARAASHANFEEGMDAQRADLAQHQSGAGWTPSPVMQPSAASSSPSATVVPMLGVTGATETSTSSSGPSVESAQAAEEPAPAKTESSDDEGKGRRGKKADAGSQD